MKLLTIALLLCVVGCVKTVNEYELREINTVKARTKSGAMYYVGSEGKYDYFVHEWVDQNGRHTDNYRSFLCYKGDRFPRTSDEDKWQLIPAVLPPPQHTAGVPKEYLLEGRDRLTTRPSSVLPSTRPTDSNDLRQ